MKYPSLGKHCLLGTTRCVLKRCILDVPLKAKASIEENAKEWKVPVCCKADCLGGVLWSLLDDLRQSQLAGTQELHNKVEKF